MQNYALLEYFYFAVLQILLTKKGIMVRTLVYSSQAVENALISIL